MQQYSLAHVTMLFCPTALLGAGKAELSAGGGRVMIAKTFGRYRIEKELGAGAMGVVYQAWDVRLDRRIALKLLGEQLRRFPAGWGWLLQEARIASALNHPCICTIYDVGEEDGEPFIAMEYVEGTRLDRLVPHRGLPTMKVLRYGAQIAAALAHAHEHGVIHRDIKTANIMITREDTAKVLDFGLAKRVRADRMQELTRSHLPLKEAGAEAGTIPYLAPEILRGEKSGVRSDLWSLGVVLYEMAAGSMPFKGRTIFELSVAIMTAAPRRLPSATPARLARVIEHCLRKDVIRRYPGANHVLLDLGAAVGKATRPWEPWGTIYLSEGLPGLPHALTGERGAG
jgi:serine/threonine protein kinase